MKKQVADDELILSAVTVQVHALLPDEARADLEAWEKENLDGHSVSTLDWPGWFKWFPPPFRKMLARHLAVLQQPSIVTRYHQVSRSTRWNILSRDTFTCRQCGSHIYLTIDHIIPLSKGGTDDPENLQVLCRSCNSRKGIRLP